MVSFHCDACTDVVKKPKLDHHYGRCRASFTCIDCSATFAGPAQWKGHTTCVTEAEKYQKTLYKGPKKGQGSQPGSRYQQNARAKSTHATGANSTPLGSPHRMSPVDLSAAEPPSLDPAAIEHGKSNKRNSEAVVENHTSNGTEPKVKKRKKKHDREDATADKTTDVASEQLQNPPSTANSPQMHKGDKKIRDSSQPEAQTPTEGAVPEKSVDEKKAKKRKHKENKADGAPPKQSDATEEATGQLEPVARQAEVREKKKKRGKDTKANVDEAAPTATVNVVAEEGATVKRRKDKESVENDGEKPKKKRKRPKVEES
ncbi:hypothetical protein BJV78DRAFT_457350 [Lactifluus subvellereus]|nr:hypothetical protein BJV78DRAFT_457350 [Lactifluus subvellereus]